MKDDKHSEKEGSVTRTKRTQKTTGTGSLGGKRLTSKTSNTSSGESRLEKEAREFRKKKSPPARAQQLNARIFLAGVAMNALLVRQTGYTVRREDIKREAYEWADYFLGKED